MKPVPPPNYTQLPNYILDHLDEFSSEAELKVVLAIARKTFGWHKKSDKLSLSQLVELTGMTRQSVISGLETALADGWIERIGDGQGYSYSVVVQDLDQLEPVTSLEDRPEVVQKLDTQKKELKKKTSGGEKPPPWGAEVERLMGIFSQASGTQLPILKSQADYRAAQTQWIKPIQEIVRNCNGNSERAMTDAVRYLKQKDMVCTYPKQVVTVALSVNSRRTNSISPTPEL